MGQIKEDIKNGQFKNIYLLYGEEAFLRNYYKKALRDALVDPEDNLNYSYFEGSRTDMNSVIDLINTMPFLSDHRVVLCENTGWLAGEEEDGESTKTTALTDALKVISEDVVFILCEEKIDKRTGLYKFANKNGVAEEFKKETPESLARWVQGYVKNRGKRTDPSTAMYIVNEIGTDMTLLSLELDKLVAWCLDRDTITNDDVDTVCTHQVNNKIFDMITAISNRRQREALRLYYDLLTLRESPFHILALLVRQYTNLLAVKDGLSKNRGVNLIAEQTGIQDWLVRRLSGVARNMSFDDIRSALEACAEADQDIKNGNLNETLSIELLIISLSNRL